MAEIHTVPAAAGGQRLDRYLKHLLPALPYVAVQKWLRTGQVRVNGKRAKGEVRLAGGDEIRLPPAAAQKKGRTAGEGAYQATAADRALVAGAKIFEDDAVLVLNKPAGLPAQAGGGYSRSLDRILAAIYGAGAAPKLAHRLDRETTGVMVLGKTRAAAAALGEAFRGREVRKEYLALVTGVLPGEKGEIDLALKRAGARVVAGDDGDAARTRWRLLASVNERLHLLLAEPLTGRMNQLRAHLAAVGLPIIGDGKYGGPAAREAGRELHATGPVPLYLHAWRLGLTGPDGVAYVWVAPLPPHFERLTTRLGHATLGAVEENKK
jgi:23S rRNA pseudouridine955/2504/2580 synthase